MILDKGYRHGFVFRKGEKIPHAMISEPASNLGELDYQSKKDYKSLRGVSCIITTGLEEDDRAFIGLKQSLTV